MPHCFRILWLKRLLTASKGTSSIIHPGSWLFPQNEAHEFIRPFVRPVMLKPLAQLMKLTQKKCSIKLPNTKSANALCLLLAAVRIRLHRMPYLSSLMPSNSFLFSGFVCILKLAVRTNWPTVALKPDKKALKGYESMSVTVHHKNHVVKRT